MCRTRVDSLAARCAYGACPGVEQTFLGVRSRRMRNMAGRVLAIIVVASASWANAAVTTDVTGWAVHNGTATVPSGPASNPTFAGADNMTLMAPFDAVTLANNGDFIEATTTLTMTSRTAN